MNKIMQDLLLVSTYKKVLNVYVTAYNQLIHKLKTNQHDQLVIQESIQELIDLRDVVKYHQTLITSMKVSGESPIELEELRIGYFDINEALYYDIKDLLSGVRLNKFNFERYSKRKSKKY